MKRIVILSLCSVAMLATPALAERKAKRIGCFVNVDVPAKYTVKQVLVEKSYRQYVKRANGRIDLMEYPAVYREDRTLVEEAHTVMRQVTCK